MLSLKITGMHCVACALNIDLDLEEVPGVKSAKTNYARQITEVEYDESKTSLEIIKSTIAKTGYQVVD
ncbi:MAG: Copper-translocating P-type ATPase [Candidatus Amesbacteria bacterium GW2011_GWA2_47_11b]|uniref:Copper-translocating P-type ATPase n=3 Tax=Candidatus Amesiibacteriota TaxID=1752730 RepID=A0A0G1SK86_9BACT|nr:MAG: Copper-translocating P-type ATPase [Microgenomates group bacterium GW2011_GWC1_46_20]KKU58320.1 MAG: Copper-translocating P-type ATPase [Candidatus Amesbacteria bacterium GW2011_GWA2_47_11b]KKU69909.1 MAG: Copper-translocating P-type ATPase [Candidatus Amesbacteria bacterium GW2011_GWA1_47_20]KKU84814.1 MAG: Copper-translocating P-type ATPase [Candidatus Amesbacteria bacterium GW2011_GWC2_47_8]